MTETPALLFSIFFIKKVFYTIESVYDFPFPLLVSNPPNFPIHPTTCFFFLSQLKKQTGKQTNKNSQETHKHILTHAQTNHHKTTKSKTINLRPIRQRQKNAQIKQYATESLQNYHLIEFVLVIYFWA